MNRTSCSRKAAKEYLTFDVFIEDWFVTINPLVGSYYLCQSWKPRKLILMATRIQIFSIRGSVDCTPLERAPCPKARIFSFPPNSKLRSGPLSSNALLLPFSARLACSSRPRCPNRLFDLRHCLSDNSESDSITTSFPREPSLGYVPGGWR